MQWSIQDFYLLWIEPHFINIQNQATYHTIPSKIWHIYTSLISNLPIRCWFLRPISEKALPTQQLIPLQIMALFLPSFSRDIYLLTTFTSNILINWHKPEGSNFHAGSMVQIQLSSPGQRSHVKSGSKQLACNHGATGQKPALVFFTVATPTLVLSLYHSILIVLNSRTTQSWFPSIIPLIRACSQVPRNALQLLNCWRNVSRWFISSYTWHRKKHRTAVS